MDPRTRAPRCLLRHRLTLATPLPHHRNGPGSLWVVARHTTITTGGSPRLLPDSSLCAIGSGVCVYYCSTYYKAVRGGAGGVALRVDDMCYERLRAQAFVTL
jgi:hypothetical protein